MIKPPSATSDTSTPSILAVQQAMSFDKSVIQATPSYSASAIEALPSSLSVRQEEELVQTTEGSRALYAPVRSDSGRIIKKRRTNNEEESPAEVLPSSLYITKEEEFVQTESSAPEVRYHYYKFMSFLLNNIFRKNGFPRMGLSLQIFLST